MNTDLELLHAIRDNKTDLVKKLVNSGHLINPHIVHFTVEWQTPDIVEFILDNTKDKNARESVWEKTPLHTAFERGNLDIIKLLIDNDADPSIEDKRGYLPLELSKNNEIRNKCLAIESIKKSIEKKADKFLEELDNADFFKYTEPESIQDVRDKIKTTFIKTGSIIDLESVEPHYLDKRIYTIDTTKLLDSEYLEDSIKNIDDFFIKNGVSVGEIIKNITNVLENYKENTKVMIFLVFLFNEYLSKENSNERTYIFPYRNLPKPNNKIIFLTEELEGVIDKYMKHPSKDNQPMPQKYLKENQLYSPYKKHNIAIEAALKQMEKENPGSKPTRISPKRSNSK